jgi:cellulose synthase/poly-beta-1,6-N-acetylglucosamine synthase-like glycosyltransferase
MSNRHTASPIPRIRCGLRIPADADSDALQVPELVSQRRRWLNGSFFAAIHGTVKFHYIYRSSHSFARKFWIHVELLYQTFNLIFSWFGLVRLLLPLAFSLSPAPLTGLAGKLFHLVLRVDERA